MARCGRAIIGLSVALALACGGGAMAEGPDDLYRAQTIVTGQGETNRLIGFGACLEDVLIKVSGAQQLAGSRRLAAQKANAKNLVRAFDYHDQMSGKPKRDEQGTRDRPYDLIVDFDARKINDALGALGLKPWLSHRPVLAMFVEIQQGSREFVITADAEQSALQRELLQAAAIKRGMPVLLPGAAALAKAGIKGAELGSMPSSALSPVVAELGGEVALIGRLVWTIPNSDGPPNGGSTGMAGRIAGRFAERRSTKRSGAASAARRKFCRATAIRRSFCGAGCSRIVIA